MVQEPPSLPHQQALAPGGAGGMEVPIIVPDEADPREVQVGALRAPRPAQTQHLVQVED